MISLLKSYNYTAKVKGEYHTVRAFNIETALEYFQLFDPCVGLKDIRRTARTPTIPSKGPTLEERILFPTETKS